MTVKITISQYELLYNKFGYSIPVKVKGKQLATKLLNLLTDTHL